MSLCLTLRYFLRAPEAKSDQEILLILQIVLTLFSLKKNYEIMPSLFLLHVFSFLPEKKKKKENHLHILYY